MKKKIVILMILSNAVFAQYPVVGLYDKGVPGIKETALNTQENVVVGKDGITRINNVMNPTLTVIMPKKRTSDASVVICPGGGYGILAWDHEGISVGEWFASKGITAFVLKYRLPQYDLYENAEIRPLQDAQQAFRYIRKNAQKYGLDTEKVGIMGFSAGGHLAASTCTHYDDQVGEIKETSLSVKPNFAILMYPVISFSDKYAHLGSRKNLLNDKPSIEKIEHYSNELQVKKETPPTFLVHAFDDPVLVNNSLLYFKALKDKGIPSEMHIYDRGGHGFSMKKSNKGPVASWPARLEDWLKLNNWMK